MIWIDIKYANLLSSQLQHFKVKKHNPYLANFRCPICGDSKKSTYKSRGYLKAMPEGWLMFKCHNCHLPLPFEAFLKRVDAKLYEDYLVEVFKNKRSAPEEPVITMSNPIFTDNPLKKLKKISQLTHNHPAKLYVLNRKIENPWHAKLYYCPKFTTFTNSLIPDKLDLERGDEPRLIIPLLNEDGTLMGYTGRSFDPKADHRYIMIILQEGAVPVFNLDGIDQSKDVFVTEGPTDAMMLPNAIAALKAELMGVKSRVPLSKCIMIPDRDVRNREVMKQVSKQVDSGFRVCMLPENFPGKDLNEAVLNGIEYEQLTRIIYENTYEGLAAKMHFATWQKID